MFRAHLISLSNFGGKRAQKVGSKENFTCFGAYDMAGNVREWVSNETEIGHITCGGGWNDYSYRYGPFGQLPSMDRSAENGFRCVKYLEPEKIPATAFRRIDFRPERDFLSEKPADEKIFRIYKSMFFYDPIKLNEKSEVYDDSNEDWTIQKISFTAAYDNEIVYAYLYLPKNASPPYQTLVYFPGTGATFENNLVYNQQTNWFIDYILKSGRAVLFPVYKGTFERIGEPIGSEREYIKKCILDFRRSVDYLMTRTDIDTAKIAYYGHSWGGRLGGVIPAIEDRVKVSILILGGMGGNKDFPETDNINYITRIKIPVLMLNGKFDYAFNYEKSVLPFYKLLGTPAQDKRLVMYETDHYVPKDQMIKEVLDWLDKYFGPVNFK
jgi:dipeptidyl aminopeptidase/acylaminoacyl peptidase